MNSLEKIDLAVLDSVAMPATLASVRLGQARCYRMAEENCGIPGMFAGLAASTHHKDFADSSGFEVGVSRRAAQERD